MTCSNLCMCPRCVGNVWIGPGTLIGPGSRCEKNKPCVRKEVDLVKTLKEQLAEYDCVGSDYVRHTILADDGSVSHCSILVRVEGCGTLQTDKIIAVYRQQPDGSLKPLEKRKKSWSEQLKERGAKYGDSATFLDIRSGEARRMEVSKADLLGDFDQAYKGDTLLHVYRMNDNGELKEVEG